MANYLLALDNIPNVLSTSYAFNEPGLSPSASNTLCNAYMQLGARGTSVVSVRNVMCAVDTDGARSRSLLLATGRVIVTKLQPLVI